MQKKDWSLAIEAHTKSGKPVGAWCEENGYNLNRFYYWRRRLKKESKPESPGWVQVHPGKTTEASGIQLRCRNIDITVCAGFSPDVLADVLRVVSAVCC